MEKNYKKIDFNIGNNLEEVVLQLLAYNEKGELVYYDFNGHRLYSDNVTIDSAYIEVCGKTKAELDDEIEKQREEYRREEEEFRKTIPDLTKTWIESGHRILDEEYWAEWDECVPIRLGDIYHGKELKSCLDIIQSLNDGCSLEEAKEIIDNQYHSGISYQLVKIMVKSFCNRGKEFAEFIG